MNEASIRLATLDDMFAIFEVHKDSVENICRVDYGSEKISMWLDGRAPHSYRDAILSQNIWLIEDQKVLGFVEIDGREVSKLFVRGESAFKGLGAFLLSHALQKISAAGHKVAYLESTITAEKFYKRFGFVRVGTGFFSRGESTVSIEIIKMEKLFGDLSALGGRMSMRDVN